VPYNELRFRILFTEDPMHRLVSALLVVAALAGCSSSEKDAAADGKADGAAAIASAAQPGRIELAGVSGPSAGAGWSFAQKRQVGLESQELADLLLYFDANDCKDGAIFGHTDKTPIHVLGKKTWAEVAEVKAVPTTPPVTQLAPAADAAGTAFLVQRRDGSWAAVRLTEVTPATHASLQGGGKAAVAFEWAPFAPK
jgi:hypothetical protein